MVRTFRALRLALSLVLSASIATAQVLPGAGAGFKPALGFFSRWLLEPEAMSLTADVDPYLTDLSQSQVLADSIALEPLLRRLELRANAQGRSEYLRRILNVGLLSRPEQAELLRELSEARKEAAADAEAILSRAVAGVRDGTARPEEAAELASRAWAFRLYGEKAEKGVAELEGAIAQSRIDSVRKKARTLLETRFAGHGDAGFLDSAPIIASPSSQEPPRPAAFHRAAALKGSPQALFALGRSHEGSGAERDRQRAYGWYLRASALGHPEAPSAVLRLLPKLKAHEIEAAENAAAWHLAQLASRARSASAPAKKSDLIPRIVTAALLVPALAGSIHLGGAAFSALVVAIAGLSGLEYGAMLKAGGRPVQRGLAVSVGAALALAPALGLPSAPVLAASAALVTLAELFRKDHNFERAALTLFGAVLFGFLPAHLIALRGGPFGELTTFWVFASAWVADTLGYVVGKPFGRHKIWDVSPNKSWEGSIAGFAGSLGVAAAFWALNPGMLPLASALVLGALLGTAGQLSGFASSMIKRALGVKDSGKLLPGHGGVIDRFDSLILSAAVAYYFLRFFL